MQQKLLPVAHTKAYAEWFYRMTCLCLRLVGAFILLHMTDSEFPEDYYKIGDDWDWPTSVQNHDSQIMELPFISESATNLSPEAGCRLNAVQLIYCPT